MSCCLVSQSTYPGPMSLEVVADDGYLVLRRQEVTDLEQHLAGVDGEQMDWLWEPGDRQLYEALSLEEQRDHQLGHLQASHDSFGPGPKWCFSVDIPHATYVVYIDCDLANHHVPTGQANISYACHPAYRGNGYTSRAVGLVCQFLRERTSATEAHIITDERNAASRAVARQARAIERDRRVDEHGRTMIRHILTL